MSSISAQLKRCNIEAARLKDPDAMIQLADLQRQRADCRSLLRRLPAEILGEILSLCIGVASDDGALSRVCARWRAIAVATPASIGVRSTSTSNRTTASASTIGLFWIVAAMAMNLPLLETLVIIPRDDSRLTQEVDIFEVAPRLRTFKCSAHLLRYFRTIPYKQLHRMDAPTFKIVLENCKTRSPTLDELGISETTSNISDLSFCLECKFRRNHCRLTFQAIFASLTVPCLKELSLKFSSKCYPLAWAHTQFLALCARSAFADPEHLQSLCLCDVCMTQGWLLQGGYLPALTRLAISDHELVDKVDATMRLLCALKPPSIVPHLENLVLRSRRAVSDAAFLDFVASRGGACARAHVYVQAGDNAKVPRAKF
ncbi:hypothetical protein GGX14DRAFT_569097 [Mycena pura]|uniref:F-box domain-containing protein n=1 Tax=Mycena pura TaxID=153505 RepID=A0AAD6YC20_9AGAR|nr:hypothetical protein GGX14DRAFT_569097 [Mycena pura]